MVFGGCLWLYWIFYNHTVFSGALVPEHGLPVSEGVRLATLIIMAVVSLPPDCARLDALGGWRGG